MVSTLKFFIICNENRLKNAFTLYCRTTYEILT